MRFPGKATLLKGMLIFQMFPAVLSLVALYALFDRLGQYIPFVGLNTHGGVIFAYMGGIALHVWTIKGLLQNHRWLAGRSGGAGWRDPMAGFPSGAAAAVGADSGSRVYSVVHRGHHRSAGSLAAAARCEQLYLAVGMQQYLNPQNYLWGDFAAAAVLSAIPITVVFLLAQRWLVNGLTAGGVKG